jgi:hypothetical protein
VEEFYINRRAIATPGTMVIRIGEWTTDSYLLHLRRASNSGGKIERYFVSDGSYLRRGNQSLLESLSKLTVCWSPGDPLEVLSNDTSFSIQVAAERLPGSVRWNGQSIKAEYDSGNSLVRLRRRSTENPVGYKEL